MAYLANASAPAAAVAVTNQASVPIAITCNATSPVVLTKSDLRVQAAAGANGTIAGLVELAGPSSGLSPVYLATVEVAPDYMVSLNKFVPQNAPAPLKCTFVLYMHACVQLFSSTSKCIQVHPRVSKYIQKSYSYAYLLGL